MRKIIIALTIIITTLASTVTVAAQQPPTLTVNQAVNRAMANSERLREMFEDALLTDIEARQIRERLRLPPALSFEGHLSNVVQLMRNDISRAFQHTERTAQRTQVTHSIQSLFLAIIDAETSLKFMDRQLRIDRQNLNFDRIRHEHGLISEVDYTAARNNFEIEQLRRERLEEEINRAYRALIEVVGGNPNARFTIELELDFQPLGNRPVEDYVAIALAQSASLRRQQRELSVTQYQIEASPRFSQDERIIDEITLTQAERSLQSSRDFLRDTIINLYDQIIDSERSLTEQRIRYEAMYTELAINEVQLELGRMTQMEFDAFVLRMDESRDNIRRTQNNHTLNVQRLRTPSLH